MSGVVRDTCGDSYDSLALIWANYSSLSIVSGIAGATGNCMQIVNNTQNALPLNGGPYTELYCGFRMNMASGAGSNTQIIAFKDASLDPSFYANPDSSSGHYHIYDASASLIATSTATFLYGVWQFFEIHAIQSTTVGFVEVKCNGNVLVSASNMNTGGNTWDRFVFASYPGVVYLDDIYVNNTSGTVNNGYEGDQSQLWYPPNTNGTLNQMTNNGGATQADSVNSTSPETNPNYISTIGVGLPLTSRFVGGSIPSSNLILCVTPVISASDDISGGATINSVLHSGAGDWSGSSSTVSTTIQTFTPDCLGISPLTGLAWTPSEVSAMEFGTERTA